MVQILCDVCGKVIDSNEDAGEYGYIDWKNPKQPKALKDSFCSQCNEKVKNFVHEMKRAQTHKIITPPNAIIKP